MRKPSSKVVCSLARETTTAMVKTSSSSVESFTLAFVLGQGIALCGGFITFTHQYVRDQSHWNDWKVFRILWFYCFATFFCSTVHLVQCLFARRKEESKDERRNIWKDCVLELIPFRDVKGYVAFRQGPHLTAHGRTAVKEVLEHERRVVNKQESDKSLNACASRRPSDNDLRGTRFASASNHSKTTYKMEKDSKVIEGSYASLCSPENIPFRVKQASLALSENDSESVATVEDGCSEDGNTVAIAVDHSACTHPFHERDEEFDNEMAWADANEVVKAVKVKVVPWWIYLIVAFLEVQGGFCFFHAIGGLREFNTAYNQMRLLFVGVLSYLVLKKTFTMRNYLGWLVALSAGILAFTVTYEDTMKPRTNNGISSVALLYGYALASAFLMALRNVLLEWIAHQMKLVYPHPTSYISSTDRSNSSVRSSRFASAVATNSSGRARSHRHRSLSGLESSSTNVLSTRCVSWMSLWTQLDQDVACFRRVSMFAAVIVAIQSSLLNEFPSMSSEGVLQNRTLVVFMALMSMVQIFFQIGVIALIRISSACFTAFSSLTVPVFTKILFVLATSRNERNQGFDLLFIVVTVLNFIGIILYGSRGSGQVGKVL